MQFFKIWEKRYERQVPDSGNKLGEEAIRRIFHEISPLFREDLNIFIRNILIWPKLNLINHLGMAQISAKTDLFTFSS